MAGSRRHSITSVTIGRKIVDRLLADADLSSRVEICGLLFGDAATIDAAHATANVAADPARAFEIDPQALFAAHRAARADGPTPVGCYHSHPGGDCTPSSTDAAAAEPGALWLILAGGTARLWLAEAGGFREVPLVIT